MVSRSLHSA